MIVNFYINLERNVLRIDLVIRILDVFRLLRSRLLLVRRTGSGSCSRLTCAPTIAELEVLNDDFSTVLLLPFRVPGARLDAALHIERPTLLHILRDNLSWATERDDIVELRGLLFLAVLILIGAVGREAE